MTTVAASPEAPFVVGPPPFPRLPEAFDPQPFERSIVGPGLELLVAERRAVPLLHLHAVVRAGAEDDPVGKEGLAALTLPLCREGAGGRGSVEIARQAEELGADLFTWVAWSESSLVVELLAEDAAFGLELVADLLWRPGFPAAACEKLRQLRIARLAQRASDPRELALAWLARRIYGTTPYGRSVYGDATSLRRIGRADVVDFHRRFVSPADTTLIAVGSCSREEIVRRLEPLLPADARLRPVRRPQAIPFPPPPAPRICLVDLPAASQCELRWGHASVPRSHPDRPRLELLSHLLESRLTASLRERRGFTYDVRCRFTDRRGPGALCVSTAVSNGSAAEVLREIVAEIERLRRREVSRSELDRARAHLAGTFLRSMQSLHQTAAYLRDVAVGADGQVSGRERLETLLSTTPDELRALARSHLHPDRAAAVAVGPASVLRPRLAELGELDEAPAELPPDVTPPTDRPRRLDP